MKDKIKAIMTVMLMAVIMLHVTGCASMMAYKKNQKSALLMKARTTGNAPAIKAIRSGDMIGIGIDVTAAEVILHSPKAFAIQAGAAAIDAAILYGISEGVESLNASRNDSNSGTKIANYGDNNTINNVTGDGNQDSNSGNSQETSTGGQSNFDPETSTTSP